MAKEPPPPSVSEAVKELLADSTERIRLDDFVTHHLKRTLAALSLTHFPPSVPFSDEALLARLKAYEEATLDLMIIVVLIARWGGAEHLATLENIFSRMAEADKGSAGTTLWLRLGWHPVHILVYAAGISAIAAKNYELLAPTLLTPVHTEHRTNGMPDVPLVVRVFEEMSQIDDVFKKIPGHDRDRVPRSEYLYGLLRQPLEAEFFLGKSYENLFDRFEVIAALVYADLTFQERGRIWGPIGRFGWKHSRGGENNPFSHVIAQARAQGASWPMLHAGFFHGQQDRFDEIDKGFAELMGKLNWW
jgi:hypothetical protein